MDFHLDTIVLDVADVIERDAVKIIEPLQIPGQPQVLLRLEQPFDELHHRSEQHRMTRFDQRSGQRRAAGILNRGWA